jgi:3-hydroxy-5-phosphonooxypentane-2,4-dione thiolase
MSWGLENRLSRIIKPADGRTVMLAVDHGYFLGPTTGLECIRESILPIAHLADTLMLTRGALRNDIDPTLDTPIVLRVSGGSSVLEDDLSNETILVSTEECIRMNAAGMAVQVFIGSPHQSQNLASLGKLVNEGERYGIPVIGVTAVGKEMARDARYLSLACRIIAETGGHIVKTYYCEDFERITSTCPVPVVMAGGKKLPEREALEMTSKAIEGGAAGVDMGRNIFQSDSPLGMIKAVNAVVHGNASVDDAYAVYMDEKAASGITGPGIGSVDDHKKL